MNFLKRLAAKLRRKRKRRKVVVAPVPQSYIIHFVLIVPIDKRDDTERTEMAMRLCAANLQSWLKRELGKTFKYSVETHISEHHSSYFSTHPNGPDKKGWFWANVLTEGDPIGVGFYQQFNDWVIYVDAQPAQDQYIGGTSGGLGSQSGVAVLAAKDCAAIRGDDADWTLSRAIGGCGHELLHSLGLDHPPEGDILWSSAIMGLGYTQYPNAILTQSDKNKLNLNPFMQKI